MPTTLAPPAGLRAVTGAFGYSGKYIAQLLLEAGHKVVTLTNAPASQNPFGDRIAAFPLAFDAPARLRAALAGVDVLYNTYWVRFNHRRFNYAQAVDHTLALFAAARAAGVRRIVHLSITNPKEDALLPYFAGKARLERALQESGLSYAILRPTVLFGHEDILMNNIAWALRRFPVFAVFGNGAYRLQPIHVEDLAALAVVQGDRQDNCVINGIGPETFTYNALIEAVGAAIGKRRTLVHVPPLVGYALGRVVGWWVRDTFITREEIRGLMDGLLCVNAPPAGSTRLTDWLRENASTIGSRYASELARRVNRAGGTVAGA
jgi:NADH dehydrogenase